MKSFFFVITLACLLFGWWYGRVQKQKRSVEWIERNGGVVIYDYQYDSESLWNHDEPPLAASLVKFFGHDCFFDVWAVHFTGSDRGKPVASHIEPLEHLPALRQLSIEGCKVDDISPLKGFRHLEHVTLNRTNVEDLSPLVKSTGMKTLHLSGSKNISDLAPVRCFKKLRELNLMHTQVVDLSPLSGLTELVNLDCYKATNAEYSDALETLKNLEHLDLSWTRVREEDWQKLREILPKLD